MRYSQIALSLLVIVILISVSFLSIGGCGGGSGGCKLKFGGISSSFTCASLVTTHECNSFDFVAGFFTPGECKLFGCKVGCDGSGPIFPPRDPGFFTPRGISVIRDGDFVVVDSGFEAVLHVDQITGDRTFLSNDNRGSGPGFLGVRNIAVTADGDFVVVDTVGTIMNVDQTTGDRTIISANGTSSGPDLVSTRGVVVTMDGDFVVIDNDLSGSGAVVHIDQTTGDRTFLSNDNRGSGPGFINPNDIAVTTDGDFVVTETRLGAVVHVDQITGDRTFLSDENTGSGPVLFSLKNIAVTTDGDFVVTDNSLRAVVHVDETTGDRTIISDDSTGSGPGFLGIEDIAVTTDGDFVVITDLPDRSSFGAVVHVDETTGDRTIISDENTGTGP